MVNTKFQIPSACGKGGSRNILGLELGAHAKFRALGQPLLVKSAWSERKNPLIVATTLAATPTVYITEP